jgi:hypothetical protein
VAEAEEAEAAEMQRELAKLTGEMESQRGGGPQLNQMKLPPISKDLYAQARRLFSPTSPNNKQITPFGDGAQLSQQREVAVFVPKAAASPESLLVYAVTKQPDMVSEVFGRLASDGYIDRKGFKEALVVLSIELQPPQRRRLFRKINQSGTSLINLSEFSCFIAQRSEYARCPVGEQMPVVQTVMVTGLMCQQSREGKYEMKGRIDHRPYYQSGDNFLYPAIGKWFIGPSLCSTSAYGLYTKDRAPSPLGITSSWKAWNGSKWEEQTGLTMVTADEEDEANEVDLHLDDKEARWHSALIRHLGERAAAVIVSPFLDRSPGSYRVNHTSRRTMWYALFGNLAIVLTIFAVLGVAMVAFYNACSTTVCADVVVGIAYALCLGLVGACAFVMWGTYVGMQMEETKRQAEDRRQKNLASAAGARMEG